MLNLFSLSSYVQFLGAFNFANVYSPIQDKLFEHFLNVDKRFSDLFSGMSMQISSDIDSVNSMSPLNTIEGLSTSPAIDEMKESLTRLEVEEKETKKQTEKTIKEELTMKYSRPMFMAFGLYCTFELLAFGFMDMLGCQSINASFALYNVFMIVVSLYFAICETLNIYRGCKVWSVFKPTHWWMMIVSILAFLSFVSNAWIVEGIGSKINLPIGFVEWMCYLGILLPTFPFILTMIFTSIHYRRSVNLIKENVDIISNKFNEIHKKKVTMDNLYSVFSKGDASYGLGITLD